MSGTRPTPRQKAWGQSPQFKRIGRAAIQQWNAEQHQAPICGAKVKKTGGPCQKPGLANGRCHLHGGVTPKGDDWHKPRWPAKDSARPDVKIARKLATLEKRQRAKDARLAAMTPEERARFDLWHRRHKPGSAAARAAACGQIRQDREARDRITRYAAEAAAREALLDAESPEQQVERALATLRARQDTAAERRSKRGIKKHGT